MLEDELWWDNVKNRPETADIGFLKTELRKPSFRFLNFEVGSVWLLENRYPKFSSDSAHPYFMKENVTYSHTPT